MCIELSRRDVLRIAAAAALPVAAASCTGKSTEPAPPAPADNTFLLRGARIFDGERLVDDDSVLVAQGKISAVGRNLAAPPGVTVHDSVGRTLLPGLIDAHVHTSSIQAAALGLAFGVTTMLDMLNANISVLPEFGRQRESTGRVAAADVWSAGVAVTVPGGHGTEYRPVPALEPGADPAAFVRARFAEGSDYLKVIIEDGSLFNHPLPTLTAEQVSAVVAAAHDDGRLATVHVSTAAAAGIAAAAGADLLAHVPAQRMDQRLLETIQQRGMAVITTLAATAGFGCDGAGAAFAEDPRIGRYLIPEQRAELRAQPRVCLPPLFTDAMANVAGLQRAGVPVLAGTDAPNPGTTHGASLHHELELLVRAGLRPVEALAAATSAPAQRFGLNDRGRVEPGRRADLLLVAGDPTSDITATRDIVTVWKNGFPVAAR